MGSNNKVKLCDSLNSRLCIHTMKRQNNTFIFDMLVCSVNVKHKESQSQWSNVMLIIQQHLACLLDNINHINYWSYQTKWGCSSKTVVHLIEWEYIILLMTLPFYFKGKIMFLFSYLHCILLRDLTLILVWSKWWMHDVDEVQHIVSI